MADKSVPSATNRKKEGKKLRGLEVKKNWTFEGARAAGLDFQKLLFIFNYRGI